MTKLSTLRTGRTVAAVVAVAAFVVLAVLAIAASTGTPGFALAAPVVATPATPTTAAPAAPPATVPRAVVPVRRPTAAPPIVPAPVAAPAPEPAPEPEPAPVAPPPLPEAAPVELCAGVLPVPAQTGGVQSLIGIVPLFGPFTAEAFAFSPAWAPFLGVLGPSVDAFGDLTEQAQPLLGALTPAVQQLEDAGFAALDPLYGPVRQDFLDAQADLAAQLAPGAQALATAPGTECIVALQDLLIP